MKKTIMGAICLLLMLTTLPALAEPAISRGGYTVYLGEENYLYLETPDDSTMVLRMPIGDIVSLTDTHVYSIAQDGRLFGIRLDGQETLILAVTPTEEDLNKVRTVSPYDLTGTVLSIPDASGTFSAISATTVAACANEDILYYMESSAGGKAVLKSRQLNVTDAANITIAEELATPISMLAIDDSLTIVHADHSISVFALLDNSRTAYPAVSENTVKAVSIGGKLLRYMQDENGMYAYEAEATLTARQSGGPAQHPRRRQGPRNW